MPPPGISHHQPLAGVGRVGGPQQQDPAVAVEQHDPCRLAPEGEHRSGLGAAHADVGDGQGQARRPTTAATRGRRRWPPRSCSMRWRVEAMVISRTGSASAPSRMIRPSAPTEKSPLTGLTPECTPETDWTSRPSPTCGQDLVRAEPCRARCDRARAPDARAALEPGPDRRAGRRGARPAGRRRCCRGSPAARRRRSARCAGRPGPRRRSGPRRRRRDRSGRRPG